jgi:hypothetical protein
VRYDYNNRGFFNWGQAINLLTYFHPTAGAAFGGMDVYLEKTLLCRL